MFSPNDDPTVPKSTPSHVIDYVDEDGAESDSGSEPMYSGDTEAEAQKVGFYTNDPDEQNPQPVLSEKEVHGGEEMAEHDPPPELEDPANVLNNGVTSTQNAALDEDEVV